MDLFELFIELETLLDRNGIDEAWSDWLRDYADKTIHAHNHRERCDYLRQLQLNEGAFYHLAPYLPLEDIHGEHPSEKLIHLIAALDYAMKQELHESEPTISK